MNKIAINKKLGLLISLILLMTCNGGPKVLFEGEQSINEDEHSIMGPVVFSHDVMLKISLELISGPAVDVYFLSEKQFNKWHTLTSTSSITDNMIDFQSALSIEGLSKRYTSEWCPIVRGTHYVILDNSDYGGTKPPMNFKNDVATIRYRITRK